jgi:hypothetical protein
MACVGGVGRIVACTKETQGCAISSIAIAGLSLQLVGIAVAPRNKHKVIIRTSVPPRPVLADGVEKN